MRISDYIDADLLDRFEFYNYNHAIEIITQAFPKEWSDVVECLRKLDITTDDLREDGGNETKIPKKLHWQKEMLVHLLKISTRLPINSYLTEEQIASLLPTMYGLLELWIHSLHRTSLQRREGNDWC